MRDKSSNKLLEDDFIDLNQLFKVLINYKLLILLTVVISSISGSYYGFQKKPTFIATAQISLGSFDTKKIVNPKLIGVTHKGIISSYFSNSSGGDIVLIESRSNLSAEDAEIKVQGVIDYYIEYSNNQIQEGIDGFYKANDNRIEALESQLIALNDELFFLNQLKTLDKSNDVRLNLAISDLRIDANKKEAEKTLLELESPIFSFSNVINEVDSFQSPARKPYTYALIGAIIGLIFSIFLAVIRYSSK